MDAGLLLARLTVGLLMAAHGSQKLFGWFGGPGLTGTAGLFDALGFRPGRFFAAIAAVTEVSSGALVAIGLLEPVGGALMVSVMIVAASVHWQNGLFAMSNGIEVPLLYGVVAASLTLIGPGAYSIDEWLGLQHRVDSGPVDGAVGVLGGGRQPGSRRPVARARRRRPEPDCRSVENLRWGLSKRLTGHATRTKVELKLGQY